MHVRLFLLLIVCSFAIRCTQGPQWPLSEGNADANIQIAQDLFEAFNKHDWVAMAGFYSNPAQMLDPAYGPDYIEKKHEEIIAKYAAMEAECQDIRDEIVGIHASKNVVTIEFVSTGTNPDGTIWKLPICTVLTIQDGKIIRDATYYDLPE